MAFVLTSFELDDYDEWKELFDSDPVGRKSVAKGHIILRAVDNPNQVFLRAEFATVADANAYRERLLASGVLDRYPARLGPIVAELADEATY